MSNITEICVVPVAKVEGVYKTVLIKLKKQGAVLLGFGDEGIGGRRDSITEWLRGLGAVDLQDYQVENVGYVTHAGAVGVVNDASGHFGVRYTSSLPMTLWKKAELTEQDFARLASRPEHVGVSFGEVYGWLLENPDTSIGVALATIWDRINDPITGNLREVKIWR